MKPRHFLLFTELGHTVSVVVMTSLLPLLIAQQDPSGQLLSVASILANLLTIFFLPGLIRSAKQMDGRDYMLASRLLLLVCLVGLWFYQGVVLLILVQALVILLVSLQQVNRNRLLNQFAGGVNPHSLFMFEVGDSMAIFLVSILLFLSLDVLSVTPGYLLAGNGLLVMLLVLMLVVGWQKYRGGSELQPPEPGCLGKINLIEKLMFTRINIGFLFHRLLWFMVPLWFVHLGQAQDFFGWLVFSGIGTLLATVLLKYKDELALSYARLYNLSCGLIFLSLLLMWSVGDSWPVYLAGIIANLAAPLHRAYGRMLAEHVQSKELTAAELLGQGIRYIRVCHVALMLIFPWLFSYYAFAILIGTSLSVIFVLFVLPYLITKEFCHDPA